MPSLIPGYEYDIFISYRQKDNKGDRWVSEFVEALKTELESTFKEEISIYFDINPHDGLLETHDVDASLKEKLKCLVFIPVLSRTYCDPNSFAWKNEFEAFVEQASKDQFGLKVILPNGNITSRILPVRIHDLDPVDISLLKSQVDIIHPVDFIYYSEGVNRPLRKNDDSVQGIKQLNYRDQVNKTSLAIREIILGLKGEPVRNEGIKPDIIEQGREFYDLKKHSIPKKYMLLIGAGVMAMLIIAGILLFSGLRGRNNLSGMVSKDGRIPLVVMPFQNMSNDTSLNIWQQGIQTILITNLSNSFEELQVRQPETIDKVLKNQGVIEDAAVTPSVAGLISKKLQSNVIVQGSIKQSGNIMRFNAQLIDAKTAEVFKVFQIDGIADSILPVIDSLSDMIREFLLISVMKKGMGYDFKSLDKHFYLSNSPEAFRYGMYADKAFRNGDMTASREWGLKALEIDSNDVTSMREICYTYSNQGIFDMAKEWCLKAYNKRDQLTIIQKLWIEQTYASFFQTPNEELKCLNQINQYDDQSNTYFMKGTAYTKLLQFDKAVTEFEKSQKYLQLHSEPWEPNDYSWLTLSYIKTGQYKKAKRMLKEAEEKFPDNIDLTEHKAIVSLCLKDTVEANRYLEKYKSILRDISASEADVAVALANIYREAGFLEKAEVYLRKAFSLEPENWGRINNLAIFLIDKNINIEEGLRLIDKSLQLNPTRYSSFHWKGWGLYKLGNYDEALKLIEKADSLKPEYNHTIYLHLEAAKKAVAEKK
jgi:tetratricopeptide (TPR) repeat protein/TolB-like protein